MYISIFKRKTKRKKRNCVIFFHKKHFNIMFFFPLLFLFSRVDFRRLRSVYLFNFKIHLNYIIIFPSLWAVQRVADRCGLFSVGHHCSTPSPVRHRLEVIERLTSVWGGWGENRGLSVATKTKLIDCDHTFSVRLSAGGSEGGRN